MDHGRDMLIRRAMLQNILEKFDETQRRILVRNVAFSVGEVSYQIFVF